MLNGLTMKRVISSWPYLLITISFFVYLFSFHPRIFSYKLPPNLVNDYLRSQDIEDPKGLIHDRITVSDNDIYLASGYLYTTGADPTVYNFQHPPLVKYLFGFSTLLIGNPFYVQIVFGLAILILTYFLGLKLFRSPYTALGGSFLLLIDPVFSGMMEGALLDLGNAFFGLSYLVLLFFLPEAWFFQGVILGLFASSKFWSTAVIFTALAYGYKLLIQKEKINFKKAMKSFLVAFIVFALTYSVSFVKSGGAFNLIEYQGRVLRFMLSHNSANLIGGPIILFVTGYFAPWWKAGVERAADWNFLWPLGLASSLYLSIGTKAKELKFFFCLLPFIYLLLSSTQVPFTRYFLVILPLIYLNFANLIIRWYHSFHVTRKA